MVHLIRQPYDNQFGDLVAYLQWMGEPAQNTRKRLGVVVLIFMALLATLAWRLNVLLERSKIKHCFLFCVYDLFNRKAGISKIVRFIRRKRTSNPWGEARKIGSSP
jgi:hypothetical protein